MRRLMLMFIILCCLTQVLFSQVSYSLRVRNQNVSGSDFDFDVYMQSTGDPLYLAPSDIYLDFNEGNFSSPSVTPTWGGSLSWYSKSAIIDGSNRIVLSIGALFFSDDSEFDSRVALISTGNPGTLIGSFQISTISNPSGTAGLSWYYSGTSGTDIWEYYETDSPWSTARVTSYSNEAPAGQSLPVQMSNMEAESTVDGIQLSWNTQSEVNSLGFNVWRADSEDGDYQIITTSLIPSQGNNSSGAEYTFMDANVESNATFYYKIEEKGTDGSSQEFGPIAVEALFIPDVYALQQNYPNPFNPMTTFSYDVPEIADVEIKVYSLLGKEVKAIYNKQQMPGRYMETWNGTDNRGQKLASGVYFLRMQAANFVQMRKMTLLR